MQCMWSHAPVLTDDGDCRRPGTHKRRRIVSDRRRRHVVFRPGPRAPRGPASRRLSCARTHPHACPIHPAQCARPHHRSLAACAAVPGGPRRAPRGCARHPPPSFSASYANLALTQRACDATAIFGRASESHGRYLVLAAVPASLSALPPAPTHLHLAPTARRLRAAPCSRRRRRASARGGRSFVRAFISARPHLRRAARISSL